MQPLPAERRVLAVLVEIAEPASGMSVSGAGSFDEFVRVNQLALVRYATLLTGSQMQGEDLVQDVLTRLYPRWTTLRSDDGNILAYVRRSITNAHISWRRRWSTRHIHLIDDGVLPDVPVRDVYHVRDEQLWQRLLALPPKQRAAVVLRYYEDLSDADIAAALGCREVTVRTNISRGLAALRGAGTSEEPGHG
jgi:RNA polymerase sigma-70 factor (sigma-E family)